MAAYEISYDDKTSILSVGFAEPSNGDKIVAESAQLINQLIQNKSISGGEIIRVNGAASIGVAMVLGHRLAHLFQAVACYDPRLGQYIVVIAHGDKYRVSDLVD